MWKSILTILQSLQPKDWLTLATSVAALTLATISYLQRASEAELSLRKQLTDLLEKLTDLNVEAGKFRSRKSDYPPNFLSLLNDQRRFLVRQATFVADRISGLVSPFEYLVLAGGFDDIGDDAEAARYFELARTSTADPIDRGIAVRGYARYLFAQGQIEQGRREYANAATLFAGDSERFRAYRADTYVRWAVLEREWGWATESTRLLEQAATEYRGLANPVRRQDELRRVAEIMGSGRPPDAAAAPHMALEPMAPSS